MPSSSAALSFLEALQKSGLFSTQEQQDLRYLLQAAGLSLADNKGLATWCIQQGYLTKFQAKQLAVGKWRNFLLGNKYKVLEPLGQGGMGAVFRCEHIALGKEVAIKILPKEVTKDADSLKRFIREARALAALDHPNIVRAHDVDEDRGQFFIVMACIDGRTLLDVVRQEGALTPSQAASYIAQACRGSQHAHEAGWVHRDLKPGNLILDQTDTVKIMDFGLARLAASDGSVTRHDGNTVLGSPDYISPEQAMNKADIDIRADIYSLGATLYFLLAGRGPFEGEPLLQKLLAHQIREPEDVTFFRSDIPPGLSAVLKKMMAKNPDDRYATPAEVEQALLPFTVGHVPSKAPSTTNRTPGSRTTRVPRIQKTVPVPVTDPLATAPNVQANQETVRTPPTPAPAPSSTDEHEAAAVGLSRRTKLLLAGGFAVAALVVLGVFLMMYLNAPPDREARLALADRHSKQGNWKAAADIYGDLMLEAPPDSKERKAIYARIKNWSALAAILVEQFPDDIELCRIAVAHYVKQNEHAKALACMEKALAADPENPDLWHELAGQAVLQRDWKRAASALERAFRGKPDKAEWCRDRGFVYAAAKDWENYRRVCKETFDLFAARERQHLIELSYVFSQGENPRPMLEEVQRLGAEKLAENSNDPNYWYRHAAVLYRLSKWDEAMEALKKGEAYEPHRAEPLKAMTLFRLGDKEEARRVLAKHREWLAEETSRKPKTPFIPAMARWWDSLAMENLQREAEALVEGKPQS